jgi:hypothetical protein
MENKKTPHEIDREHYFSVAIAKNVFEHPLYGIVFVRDAISIADALNYKLTPVILYVVSAVGTSIHWLAFASTKNPRSFCNVLQEAWGKSECLRGAPDVLKINKHIANACPYLPAILEGISIRVEVVDGDNKRLPAALRTAQDRVTELSYALGMDNSEAKVTSISDLNERAISQHNNFDIRFCTDPYNSLAEANKLFLSLPARPYYYHLPENDTWEQGKWLSGWENNLPPNSSRVFNESSTGDTWLIEGDADTDDSMKDVDEVMESQSEADAASLIKIMLGCWPNKISEVAKTIGITARELNWYTSGRVKLDSNKKLALLTMLGIQIDGYGEYELTGGCVLMASTSRATIAAYNEISHGGDLDYSIEVVPQKGLADPSYRYVLFCSCGGLTTMLMVPRGSEASSILNAENLINYDGLKEVESAKYLDVVSTCARACVGFSENRLEALQFVSRNKQFLSTLLN